MRRPGGWCEQRAGMGSMARVNVRRGLPAWHIDKLDMPCLKRASANCFQEGYGAARAFFQSMADKDT